MSLDWFTMFQLQEFACVIQEKLKEYAKLWVSKVTTTTGPFLFVTAISFLILFLKKAQSAEQFTK